MHTFFVYVYIAFAIFITHRDKFEAVVFINKLETSMPQHGLLPTHAQSKTTVRYAGIETEPIGTILIRAS